MPRWLIWILLLGCIGAVLWLTACSGDNGPSRIEVEGSWHGPFTFPSGSTGTMTLTLQETSGSVSGNGNIVGPGGSNAVTASGTYQPPNVALNLHTTGFEDISLTGTVGEDQLTGVLQGSGFVGSSVTLHRQ